MQTVIIHTSTSNREYFIEQAHALIDILEDFNRPEKKLQDPLSKKLSAWGHTFLSAMRGHSRDSLERINELVAPHFARLDNEILRDELLSAADLTRPIPLVNPVIGHEFNETWIWSENTYHLCDVRFNHLSPIDRREMDPNPIPHSFARAMINWRTRTRPPTAVDEQKTGVVRLPSERDIAVERVGLQRLATLAMLRRMRENSLEQTQASLQEANAIEQETCVVLARAQERAEQERRALIEERQRVIAQCEAYVAQLNQRFDAQEASNRAHQQQVEENLAEAERSNQARAAELRQELTVLKEQQQKARDEQQKEINTQKQLNQKKIEALEAQQAALENRHRSEMSNMQASHAQTVSSLTNQMSNLSTQVNSAQNQLAAARQATTSQEQQVQNLRQQNASLASRLASAEQRLEDDDDDGFCSLM